jgi:hypothetical protein
MCKSRVRLLELDHILSVMVLFACGTHHVVIDWPDSLAEMCVHQTRAFILERDGYIVDNPNVGPTLATAYWNYGNDQPFLKLVRDLTGKELSGQAWVSALNKGTDEHLEEERKEYEKSLEERKRMSAEKQDGLEEDPDLDMTIRFVDGDFLIADSSEGGVLKACQDFQDYVLKRFST